MATITSTSTASTPTISSPGIGSGLDVNSIVTQLMAIEQQPLTALQNKATALQSQISAYGSIKNSLSTLQGTISSMTTLSGMQTLSASVAASGAASATVGSGAAAGSYALAITALAQAQKLVSNGLASTATSVGTGTLMFTFGTTSGGVFTADPSQAAQSVTIAAGQDSLAGVRDAINAAGIGITATIINDGSAAGQRLVLTSSRTGAASSVKIDVADDDGNATDAAGLSQLAYDPAAASGSGKNLAETQAAQDAALTIDGLVVHRPSNTVSDLIAGVTLNLTGVTSSATTLAVTANTTVVSASVSAFVAAYNSLQSTLTSLTHYDSTTNTASVLTGDSTVRTIQNQLRTLIGGSLGAGTRYDTLSDVGVTFQSDGTLALDATKLQSALTTDPNAVSRLFAAAGNATDAGVAVTATGANTVAGNYAVNISQLATQGSLTAASAPTLTVVAGVSDTLSAVVDGIGTTVTLAPGTYANAQALAAAIQARLNAASEFTANNVSVSVDASGGSLAVTSNRYGSASNVSFGGNAADGLFGASPAAVTGLDIAGTIGGYAAAGSGQKLTGATGTPVDGLAMTIASGTVGDRGSVSYSKGFAARLNDTLASMVGDDGLIQASTDGDQAQIKDINNQEDTLQRRLDQIQQAYYAQYSALDTLISSLKNTSTYLTQQLAALPKPNSINGNNN
ncbi:MAG TPA: flagellar filament capping protein FliD [Casimicrobiaceae bacterium]|nr:flagellar filament capping protein FliD [Casimicrobiaceae bacterium]